MKVIAFRQHHAEMIRPWFKHYGLSEEDFYPQIGFIAIDTEPLAVSFLRRIEGGLALFDGLMANPSTSGKRRNEALDAVVARLIEEARHRDIKKILGVTKESAVLKRSQHHGFELQPDRFIARAV